MIIGLYEQTCLIVFKLCPIMYEPTPFFRAFGKIKKVANFSIKTSIKFYN